ncbi:MAG: redoxin domain-containing protein, partial [Myxococcota bacterium]
LPFEVLSDADNQVARAYGLVFKLPEKIRAIYQEKFDLAQFNGNDKGELPLSATYVIDSQGVIRYAFLDPDYRKRAEPDAVLQALAKVAAAK